MITINGITGEMKFVNDSILGLKYYFQPFYRTNNRKNRRRK